MTKKINDLISLKNTTSLVTGGSGHLGTAISETLAELGSNVIVVGRNLEKGAKISIDTGTLDPETISIGYWDGDVLVVETTNFTDKIASFNPSVATGAGTGTSLHLTERFSLADDDTLRYEFTVNDPTTFTQPFTAILPMKRGEGMYEYACHEGNYGLSNILSGARQEERRRVP